MASAKKTVSKRSKKKQEEELLEIEDVDTEDEELDVDTEDDVEDFEEETIEEQVSQLVESEEAEVSESVVTDEHMQVKVVVLKDTPRFLVGTQWLEPLTAGDKVKLPKFVAVHLQERGRAQII